MNTKFIRILAWFFQMYFGGTWATINRKCSNLSKHVLKCKTLIQQIISAYFGLSNL